MICVEKNQNIILLAQQQFKKAKLIVLIITQVETWVFKLSCLKFTR